MKLVLLFVLCVASARAEDPPPGLNPEQRRAWIVDRFKTQKAERDALAASRDKGEKKFDGWGTALGGPSTAGNTMLDRPQQWQWDSSWRPGNFQPQPPNQDNTKTIRAIGVDQVTLLDRILYVRGKIDIGTYYNFGFRNAERNYFCFVIRDPSGTGYFYAGRNDEKAIALKNQILADGAIGGLFGVVVPRETFELIQDGQVLGILLGILLDPKIPDPAK